MEWMVPRGTRLAAAPRWLLMTAAAVVMPAAAAVMAGCDAAPAPEPPAPAPPLEVTAIDRAQVPIDPSSTVLELGTDGTLVGWTASTETSPNPEVFAWDGRGPAMQLTSDGLVDGGLDVGGGRVTWDHRLAGGQSELFVWQGDTTRRVLRDDSDPDHCSLDAERMTWAAWEPLDGAVLAPDSVVMLEDATGGGARVVSDARLLKAEQPSLVDGGVVYLGWADRNRSGAGEGADLFLFDGTENQALTANGQVELPSAGGARVAWDELDVTTRESRVVTADLRRFEPVYLSAAGRACSGAITDGDSVAWTCTSDGLRDDLFVWRAGEIERIATGEIIHELAIDHGVVVWESWQMVDDVPQDQGWIRLNDAAHGTRDLAAFIHDPDGLAGQQGLHFRDDLVVWTSWNQDQARAEIWTARLALAPVSP